MSVDPVSLLISGVSAAATVLSSVAVVSMRMEKRFTALETKMDLLMSTFTLRIDNEEKRHGRS